MRSLENLKQILDQFVDFVEENRGLLDTNNVQFLVDNHWNTNTILNENLKNDLEIFLNEKRESDTTPANLIKYFACEQPGHKFQSLNELFKKLKSLFDSWDNVVCTDQEDLLKTDRQELVDFNQMVNEKLAFIQKQNRFMNLKKAYEVMNLFRC